METGQVTILEMKKENAKEMAQLLKTIVFKDVRFKNMAPNQKMIDFPVWNNLFVFG